MKNKIYVFCVILLLITDAFAYLDSGTGSMIAQFLIGGTAFCWLVIGSYWCKIKQYIKTHWQRLKSAHNKQQEHSTDDDK